MGGGRYFAGMTWWGVGGETGGVVDLVTVSAFAHEMHHVDLGWNAGHEGWCPVFTDWEKTEPTVLVDDSYLCK